MPKTTNTKKDRGRTEIDSKDLSKRSPESINFEIKEVSAQIHKLRNKIQELKNRLYDLHDEIIRRQVEDSSINK